MIRTTTPRALTLALLASSALLPCTALAQSLTLPTDGQVVRGEAHIDTTAPGGMTIRQTTDRAVIDWRSFSVGQDAHVDIVQNNATSALLNRVTGDTTSTIAGRITANGQVFLVNPNGILITKTGSVQAAGFVASTLDLSNDAFMASDIVVTGRGGSVTNAGQITIVKGGYAALIGGRAENSGAILAPLGRVGIGSATRATLDLEGDGFLQVALPATDAEAGVYMPGRIVADGGAVVLAAGAAREAARGVVNMTGSIEARGLEGRSGSVTLTGGAIALTGARIDASGATGGGTIKIGGDRQGGGALARATTLDVDAASTIRTDATGSGKGGDVVLWSDQTTRFAGTISARGAGTGEGGAAEVSGKAHLAYAGTTDLRGPGGFGTLLLDPHNVTILAAGGSGTTGFTATTDNSIINATTLTTALATANVTVSTGSSGTQAGDITLAASTPLTWNSGATLTLNAAGSIELNSAIRAAAGGLTIAAGGTVTDVADLSVARFTLSSGDWVQNGSSLPGFATADFRIAGGSFLRVSGGNGSSGTPYRITDVYGLQGIGSSSAFLSANWQLANAIDASGTATWNDGMGFKPIGDWNTKFTGLFDGTRFVIDGLTIDRPLLQPNNVVGLFGVAGPAAIIRDLGLTGVSITGADNTGGLVGAISASLLSPAEIRDSYVTGTVSGRQLTGMVIGYGVFYSATGIHSEGAATGSDRGTGGLIGVSARGTLNDSYSLASVTGTTMVGGLAGYISETVITNAYATGQVSGTTRVGGAIGYRANTTMTNVYWDVTTSGQTRGVGEVSLGSTISGGATPFTTRQARTGSSYTGFNFTTTWYQAGDMRPILRSEAAAAVNGVTPVSNLHQLQLVDVNPSGNYVLTRDIDATATNGSVAAGIWGGWGFQPIAAGTGLTGQFDGQSHVVKALTINTTAASTGLFARVASSGVVRNLGLASGTVRGSNNTGALVGYSAGTLENVWSSADVSALERSSNVGGLVGQNAGTISRAYVSGSKFVDGGAGVGGLVGTATQSSNIEKSYATGFVGGNQNVGGLIGRNEGTVSDVYSLSTVAGLEFNDGISITLPDSIAGLIGSNYGLSAVVSRAYSSGLVSSSTTSISGSIADFSGGSATSVYWDTTTSHQNTGVNRSGGTGAPIGLTTAQARTESNFTGFDFTNVWYQAGDMRPILRSEAATAVNGRITVSNLHQLQLMGANLTASYRLTQDIDASATAGSNASGIWGAGGFVPVGDTVTRFTGVMSGAGHVVTGLTINRIGSDIGLFGVIGTTGTVTEIGLVDGSVTGATNTGSLAGSSAGTISLSYATGTVNGGNVIGGLVGQTLAGGSINQSYASTQVTASSVVGGLVGQVAVTSSVTDSYATGAVIATASSGSGRVGGLVGLGLGTISRTYATGSVTSPNYNVLAAGGLVGNTSSTATTTDSYWNSQTSGRSDGIGIANQVDLTTGLTTAQMQDLTSYTTNFAGFDFDRVWAPPTQIGQGGATAGYYPTLSALSKVAVVQPGAATAVYGDAPSSVIASYAGVKDGDFVTTGASVASSVSGTPGVGNYASSASGAGITSATSGGYRIIYLPGALNVTARPITVTADAASRVYGNADPALTYTIGGRGMVGSDTLTGALATAATGTSGVGTYAIGQGTLTGGSNYALTYVGADLSITPRAITVTADGAGRLYGDANPALTWTVGGSGLVNGDTLSGALGTTATATSGVGRYTIGQGTLTGGSNYALTYVGADLAVSPRAITVTADGVGRLYGDANPALTWTVGGYGLVNGDTLTGTLGTTATATSGVGRYAIGQNTLAANGNYALTFVGADLAVAPRPITVTADAASRLYGDANPALTWTVGGYGLVNGDTLTGALTTTATVTSGVGNYAIGQNTLAANSNYALTYVGADLSVAPRTITVTADAASRLYGNANPALTYSIGGNGLVNGDTLSGTLGTTATAASGVGRYAIAQNTLAGGSNYALTYVGADLSVTPRAITVTADALSRIYGNANPALTYTVGGSGLVNGDTLSGALATTATATSGVGTYAVNYGSLAAGTNYAVVYVGANLAVTPRPITITANSVSRDFGRANPPLTWTIGGLGLVNGDVIAGSLKVEADASSIPGAYPILRGSVAASANYAVTYSPGTLAVIASPVVAPEVTTGSVSRDTRGWQSSTPTTAGVAIGSGTAALPTVERTSVQLPGEPAKEDERGR